MKSTTSESDNRYAIIGELFNDVVNQGEFKPGGQPVYSGQLAVQLGRRTMVLSTVGKDFNAGNTLDRIELELVPSRFTTTCENIHADNPEDRIWIQHDGDGRILPEHVPRNWLDVPVIQFGLNTRQTVSPEVIEMFDKNNQVVGLAPQGIFRYPDDSGLVHLKPNPEAERMMRASSVTILGEPEILTPGMLEQFVEWSDIFVLTKGPNGSEVYQGSMDPTVVEVEPQENLNPVGLGDIYAAAYFIHFANTKDPIESAEFANLVASHAILDADPAKRATRWHESPQASKFPQYA